MPTNLLIVESPSKVKTISSFLGGDFVVKSCYGHVRDLPKKNLGISIEDNFEPVYEVSPDKKKIIAELFKASEKSDFVWLATDKDREGEAISWHLKEALNLPEKKIKRITFNEITKKAVEEAIKSPEKINDSLVNAQQARRILDRIVGFELSPVLWKKIKTGLSAGRVQSVAAKLIVEKEREIEKFTPEISFPINAVFSLEGTKKDVKAKLKKPFQDKKQTLSFLNACLESKFTVESIVRKKGKKTPSSPFTTSTLQQEANRKLGMGVSQTMRVAQTLYEAGKITYMRTDSVRLSDDAMAMAAETISEKFGKEYSKPRVFNTKSKSAQEAHEAIRPVNFAIESSGMTSQENRLYSLIWKRTLASQMADAEINRTTVTILASKDTSKPFVATGEEVLFEGFLKLYVEGNDDETNNEETKNVLPEMSEGMELLPKSIVSKQNFSRHPARYTEASLVKALEENGIGRPSTYVSIISTIQKREYVVKKDKEPESIDISVLEADFSKKSIIEETKKENYGGDKNKLFPTDIGRIVNDFLESNFSSIMKYDFTARVEREFDDIAEGNQEWKKMLKTFYTPFNSTVEKVTEESERVNYEKVIGILPETNEPIVAKIGKYGPFLQVGEKTEEKKPKYYPLNKNESIETVSLESALETIKFSSKLLGVDPKTKCEAYVKVGSYGPYVQLLDTSGKKKPKNASIPSELDYKDITLEESLKLFELPRLVGEHEGKEIEANNGRFGPYLKYDGAFVSFPKGTELAPISITLEEAVELIEKKKEDDRKKYLYQFDDGIKVAIGKVSPYVVYKGKMLRLKKDVDVKSMKHEDFIKLLPNYKKK